jgi:hypothetical protein
VTVRAAARSLVMQMPAAKLLWTSYRGRQLVREYRTRRERYAMLSAQRGIRSDEGFVLTMVRDRLAARGWQAPRREPGEVHTFAFVPLRHEHGQLLTDLHRLGPVSLYDPVARGYHVDELRQRSSSARRARLEMNREALEALFSAHSERPVDWIYVYASGLEISAGMIEVAQARIGAPTVNLCMDDKHSWSGPWMGDHRAGQVDIARVFDLSVTTSPVAVEWYAVEGGRAIYMPEGFDADAFHPMMVPRDIPVSFVGAAYGTRPEFIRYLRRNSIPIETFGSGWRGSRWVENVCEIFNRSIVNLGIGGVGYSGSLTTLKGRDFDVPGTGGGAYVTTYNPDLARHFNIGTEIACYRTRDEAVEIIRWLLANQHEAAAMAERAHARAVAEHRWLHRYSTLLRLLGVLA